MFLLNIFIQHVVCSIYIYNLGYYAVPAMCVKPPKDILNYDYMLTERGPSGRSSPLKGKLLIKRRSLFTRALSRGGTIPPKKEL